MREPLRDPARLEHILTAINNVAEFVEGKTQEDLVGDKMFFFAVVKNIEIIGEAANYVTKELRDAHPEIDWTSIIGMRHVLVHDYYTIKPHIAWITATVNLPSLKPQIETLLKEMQQ